MTEFSFQCSLLIGSNSRSATSLSCKQSPLRRTLIVVLFVGHHRSSSLDSGWLPNGWPQSRAEPHRALTRHHPFTPGTTRHVQLQTISIHFFLFLSTRPTHVYLLSSSLHKQQHESRPPTHTPSLRDSNSTSHLFSSTSSLLLISPSSSIAGIVRLRVTHLPGNSRSRITRRRCMRNTTPHVRPSWLLRCPFASAS